MEDKFSPNLSAYNANQIKLEEEKLTNCFQTLYGKAKDIKKNLNNFGGKNNLKFTLLEFQEYNNQNNVMLA
jgi:hypothetical protein